MFWRKKRDKENLYCYLGSNNRRQYFRLDPSGDQPVYFNTNGDKIIPNDISAGGVSFQNTGYRPGDTIEIELVIPGYTSAIRTNLDILAVSGKGVCHCSFRGLVDEGKEVLHQYILMVQREKLRSRKKLQKEELKKSTKR